MAIPAYKIVQISPRVIQAGGSDLVLNGLFLTASELLAAGQMKSFSTPEEVEAFFGADAPETEAAEVYFASYDNSFRKPERIFFGGRPVAKVSGAYAPVATHARLRGGRFSGAADLTAAKGITAGAMNMTIDNVDVTLESISFASCTSEADVAAALQTAIRAEATALEDVTCEYNVQAKAFWITSSTTGTSSTITAGVKPDGTTAANDIAAILCLRDEFYEGETDGDAEKLASVENGIAAPKVSETFAALKGTSENWALVTTVYDASLGTGKEALDLAEWASKQRVEYMYICWSTDENLKTVEAKTDENSQTTIAGKFLHSNVGATGLIYGDLRYAAFILSIPASIDWNREQGVVTAAFKTQEGLAPYIDTPSEADRLIDKRCNFYGAYASRNDKFVWLYPGAMYGNFNFLDCFWNMIWLGSAIQTSCMMGFKQTPRVPYNEDGYTLIRAWIQEPINRGRKNGIIDTGMTLSEPQKAQFLRETGMNDQALSCLVNDGFFLVVRDGSPNDRVNRDSPEVSLYFTYAGSVQKLVVPVSMFV